MVDGEARRGHEWLYFVNFDGFVEGTNGRNWGRLVVHCHRHRTDMAASNIFLVIIDSSQRT